MVIAARGSPSEIFEAVHVVFHVAGHLFGRFILAEIVDKSALRVDEVDDDGVVHDVVVVLVGLRRRTEVHPERLGGLGDLLRRSRQAEESGWKFYGGGGNEWFFWRLCMEWSEGANDLPLQYRATASGVSRSGSTVMNKVSILTSGFLFSEKEEMKICGFPTGSISNWPQMTDRELGYTWSIDLLTDSLVDWLIE